MIFNTIAFYALFIVFLIFFVILKKNTRTGMMIYVTAFSLFFFYEANAKLCFLLPATAVFSWLMTKMMCKAEGSKRTLIAVIAIVVDLIPLIYYKYANFGIEVFNEIMHQNFPLMQIALPIGISFYTFQAISHIVDVYRMTTDNGQRTTDCLPDGFSSSSSSTLSVVRCPLSVVRPSLLEYMFYLTFFPLLLAGPITRAETFFPQIRKNKLLNTKLIYTGLWLIMIGLVKKSVIADYIAQYNNWIFDDPTAYSGFENLMGIIGYTVQIYCDFSGYSDMSIGIAALMGIELKENFNLPYQSLNISEFWRRWHISLSTWFRDYLYIPLGGNRKGNIRTFFNNFFTMLIAGLWHGSTPMFLIWGAMHGLALILHKACKKLFLDRVENTFIIRFLSWSVTFLFIMVAWVFFRASDLVVCQQIFTQIAYWFDMAYLPYFIQARPLWTAVVVFALLTHCIRERHFHALQQWYVTSHWTVKLLLFIIVVQLAVEFSSNNVQPFIYSNF